MSVAYWLLRAGFDLTIVEAAAALRLGWQAVDFRGRVHLQVLQAMNRLEALRDHQDRMASLVFVDDRGRPRAQLSSEFAGGDIEIMRGRLIELLHDAVRPDAEIRFGTTIRKINEHDRASKVELSNGSRGDFDVIVGADGMRSNVRQIVFGADTAFIRETGYQFATYPLDPKRWSTLAGHFCSEPGPCVGISATEDGRAVQAAFFFEHETTEPKPRSPEAKADFLRARFLKMRWVCREILAELEDPTHLFADTIGIVNPDRIFKGRVVLVGDAAYGGMIGGMGAGLAVVGAYVLGQELLSASNSPWLAWYRYHRRFSSYAARCQKGAIAVGPFFAPRSTSGIRRRDWLLRALPHLPGKRPDREDGPDAGWQPQVGSLTQIAWQPAFVSVANAGRRGRRFKRHGLAQLVNGCAVDS